MKRFLKRFSLRPFALLPQREIQRLEREDRIRQRNQRRTPGEGEGDQVKVVFIPFEDNRPLPYTESDPSSPDWPETEPNYEEYPTGPPPSPLDLHNFAPPQDAFAPPELTL